jgi:hypothetical protein
LTAVGPLQGIGAVLFLSVLLGVARPAITALPPGTIEVVIENAQGQPLARVQLTLRVATGRIVKTATSRPDGGDRFAMSPKATTVSSMLSRGGAPGVSGFSKEMWNDSRARPSCGAVMHPYEQHLVRPHGASRAPASAPR